MININDYQKTIYTNLKQYFNENDLAETNLYDEVPKETSLPVAIVGDYVVSEGLTKSDEFVFQQNINIFSNYKGKKEINNIVLNVIKAMYQLVNVDINKSETINEVRLLDSSVMRIDTDDIYEASLIFQINVEKYF